MISIVEQDGFQYKVSEGDVINVPLIDDAKEGDDITINKVFLVAKDKDVKVGKPNVEGAEVKAKVIGHGKDKKVNVMKKRARKRYKRKNGHRQDFTKIKITSISG